MGRYRAEVKVFECNEAEEIKSTKLETIDFQILNFTRPEGGIRVSRTL